MILGYSKIEEFKGANGKPDFEFRREATITGMHFMQHNLIVLTLENGNVETWSTRTDNSELNSYCPFKLTGKSHHYTTVTSSTFLNENHTKFITGDLRGSINVWDTGAADLDTFNNYNLYESEVKGISANYTNENIFFSCSNHGESFITDVRTNSKGTGNYI